jgi:hypothetical protein
MLYLLAGLASFSHVLQILTQTSLSKRQQVIYPLYHLPVRRANERARDG